MEHQEEIIKEEQKDAVKPIFSFDQELFNKLDNKNKKKVIDNMILWCKIYRPGFSFAKLLFIFKNGL